MMKSENFPAPRRQSVAMDKFLFYFFGLRKGEVKRRVERMRRDYPGESPEQLAWRLINTDTRLSLVAGAIINLALFVPGVGQALSVLGFAVATAAISAMHVSLILEIAMLFGRDIDDRARIRELAAVIAATGLGSGAPLLMRSLKLGPVIAGPMGTLTVAAVSRLIGEASIRYYRRASKHETLKPVSPAVPVAQPPSSAKTVEGKIAQTPRSEKSAVEPPSDEAAVASQRGEDDIRPSGDAGTVEPQSDEAAVGLQSEEGDAKPPRDAGAAEPTSDEAAAEPKSDKDTGGPKRDEGAAG